MNPPPTADGRIVYVASVEGGSVPTAIKNRREIPLDEIVKGDHRPPAGTLIGIFMSPFDVRYQRSPTYQRVGRYVSRIAGSVLQLVALPGCVRRLGNLIAVRIERRV